MHYRKKNVVLSSKLIKKETDNRGDVIKKVKKESIMSKLLKLNKLSLWSRLWMALKISNIGPQYQCTGLYNTVAGSVSTINLCSLPNDGPNRENCIIFYNFKGFTEIVKVTHYKYIIFNFQCHVCWKKVSYRYNCLLS